MVRKLLRTLVEGYVDAQDLMSATASISIDEKVTQTTCWRAFAPKTDGEYVLSLVTQVVEKPLFTLKSHIEDVELRFQIEDRLGIVGVLKKGEVVAACPFVRTGFEQEMEILDIVSVPSQVEGWINVRCQGLEFSFYDVLHALTEYKVGEKRHFVLNGLALSLKRVPKSGVDEIEIEMGFCSNGIRSYIPKTGKRAAEGIFQSPVEGESSITRFDGREMILFPISLKETEDQSATIDLAVASDISQNFDDAIQPGEDIAGLLWLHGYCPDLLQKRPD